MQVRPGHQWGADLQGGALEEWKLKLVAIVVEMVALVDGGLADNGGGVDAVDILLWVAVEAVYVAVL